MFATCIPRWTDDMTELYAVEALLRDEDIVAGCEFESSTHQSISSQTSSNNSTPTTSNECSSSPRVINPSRIRRRHEILTLREQEKALKRQLHAIHEARAGRSAVADPVVRSVLKQAWQELAETQWEQRKAVEEKRQQLHSTVTSQLQSIRQIQRLLQKHTTALRPVLKSSSLKIVDYPGIRHTSKVSTDPVAALLSDQPYVWNESRPLSPLQEIRDVRVDTTSSQRVRVEAVNRHVLPFDATAAAHAVWQFHETTIAEMSIKQNVVSANWNQPTELVLVLALDMPHFKGHAYGQIKTQRFVDPDGRVVIWRSCLFDRIERHDGQSVDEFGLRHEMKIVVGPPSNARLRGHSRPLSQIDKHVVTEPFLPIVSNEKIATGQLLALQRFCTASAHFWMDKERQSVENMLMDLSLGTK